MAIELSIEPFEKAIVSLDEALVAQAEQPGSTLIRDACIQRFEYTYELSHKMLKRFLEMTSANPADFDDITFQTLIRIGNERGLLLSDWAVWRTYRAARGATSHTYDEQKAIEVFSIVPQFLQEARYLRDQLRDNLGDSAA